MKMKYATEFNVEYDYDVLGGKPVYIIYLIGKDGCLAIGITKKERCEIRADTLNEAKSKCLEIRIATQLSYDTAEKIRQELGVVKMENEMPKYEYKFKR